MRGRPSEAATLALMAETRAAERRNGSGRVYVPRLKGPDEGQSQEKEVHEKHDGLRAQKRPTSPEDAARAAV